MIKRRLCSIAIISSVRFSAANRDSPCDEVVVFGPCLDSRMSSPESRLKPDHEIQLSDAASGVQPAGLLGKLS